MGTGVRDEHTIASLFAQRFAQFGWSDFHVVNYGESAYVATQSLLTLLLELRAGNIPEIVIFYDGIKRSGFLAPHETRGDNRARIVDRILRERPSARGSIASLGVARHEVGGLKGN